MNKNSVAALLLLTSVLLVSCGDTAVSETEKVSESVRQETETTVVTEETQIEPELPETDLGGYNFRVLTKGTSNVHWKSKDIYAEALNGEPINDAVFTRNSKLGEKYNFTVTEIISKNGPWDLHTQVQKAVFAGEDAYDMVAMGMLGDLSTLVSKNCLMNLRDVPYMDLSKPWYDQKAVESLSIANHLYATTGDMIIMDNEATYGILFNKQLAEELDLGDLYQLVRDGKWTIDTFAAYAREAVADLNGDGVHDEFDQWGLCGEPFNTYALMIGMGEKCVEKDAEDLPYFVLENDRFYTTFEIAEAINGDFDVCMFSDNFPKYSDVWAECIDKAFSEGRILFNCAGLVRCTVFRTMDIDFGILPLPKYDEAQESYNCCVSLGCANSIAIPTSVASPETTGLIIEAMSAESLYTLTPAYYDVVVKGKAARDEESLEMLDLIFSNRVYDIAFSFDWGTMVSTIYNLTGSKTANIASTVAKRISAAQKDLDKTIAAIQAAE